MCVYYTSYYVKTKYSYDKVKELGLVIKVSRNSLKKIDVYKKNIFLASIWDSRYQEYPNCLITYNIEYTN